MKVKIATTEQIRPYAPSGLGRHLDPNGLHCFLNPPMLHNDCEVRSRVYLKLDKRNDPFTVTVTVPLELYNSLEEREG